MEEFVCVILVRMFGCAKLHMGIPICDKKANKKRVPIKLVFFIGTFL